MANADGMKPIAVEIHEEGTEAIKFTDGSIRVKITDGTDNADVIQANGQLGLVTIRPGHVSTLNSTTQTLGPGGVWTGTAEDVTNHGVIQTIVRASHASATDGFKIEFSPDGTNWDSSDEYTIVANTGKIYSFQPAAQYFRISYTNGGDQQTYFRLQTTLKPYYVKPSSHRINDIITPNDDAELVKAVLTAALPSGLFTPIDATAGGNLKVSIEEFDSSALPISVAVNGPISVVSGSIANTSGSSAVYQTDGLYDTVLIEPSGTYSGYILFARISEDGSNWYGVAQFNTLGNDTNINFPTKNAIAPSANSNFKYWANIAGAKYFQLLNNNNGTGSMGYTFTFSKSGSVASVYARGQTVPADAQTNPTTAIEALAKLQAFNGTTYDRLRSVNTGQLVTTHKTSGGVESQQPTYYQKVAEGAITGEWGVNKFGAAPNGIQSTATDIWDRADATPTQSIWLAPTAARVHAIVSTSTDDDGNPVGLGARTLRVYGLTSWSASAETSEDITLNGTGSVNTSNSYVIIHRMKVLTSGASGPNVGTITATAAAPDSTVTAAILPGNGQTEMAIYGIPSTKTAYLLRWGAQIDKTTAGAVSADFRLMVNETPTTNTTVFLRKGDISLQSTGTSLFDRTYAMPYEIPGPAIIKIQAIGSANDIDGEAGFDLLVK